MRFDLENLPTDATMLHHLVRDMADDIAQRDDQIERLKLIIRKGWRVVGQGIAPCGELTGFQITSPMQPGITMIQLGSAIRPKLRANPPRAVRDQAASIVKPGQSMQIIYTAGPMFTGETHMLQKSRASKVVRPHDPRQNHRPQFPSDRRSTANNRPLPRSLSSPRRPLENWTSPPLVFSASARPGPEAEVLEAMRMSLR